MIGAASDPLVPFAPDVDYEGRISIFIFSGQDRGTTVQKALIGFDGVVEPFPAFEMYVSVNRTAPVPLFQLGIEERGLLTGVWDLYDWPDRRVNRTAIIDCLGNPTTP